MTSCCITTKVAAGNAILVTFTIKDVNGNLFDPPTVYAWSYSPSGVTTPLSVTHVSKGVFTAQFTPDAPGPWIARGSDVVNPPAGASFTAEIVIPVSPLRY